MKQKVLVFFPHNISPPKSGAHRRCIEILTGLKELGYEIILLSATFTSVTKWNPNSINNLKKDLVKNIYIYEFTKLDKLFIRFFGKYCELIKKSPPLSSAINCPLGMRKWFARIFEEVSPTLILMNYAYWDKLIDHKRYSHVCRVIETLDIVTVNRQMQQVLDKEMPLESIKNGTIDSSVLQEDFFEKLELNTDTKEFQIYDKYDYTIAISKKEAELIKENTHKTKVVLIPVVQEPSKLINQYTGPALFTCGPNPFNTQGYFYFTKRALPIIKEKIPSFSLQITGEFWYHQQPKLEEGITFSGFIPELKEVYESARFFVSPVFGGTGQQIKITEAMANGLPVIALHSGARDTPIQHGINGFIANNAKEFATYIIKLWNDKKLCREMGNAARETIAKKFSRSYLLKKLNSIVPLNK